MFVYALYNQESNKIYIGQTNNVDRRLKEHNKSNKHYTGKICGQWELIYKEESNDRSSAIAREKQLKTSRGRAFIKNLIKNNPG